MSKPPEHVLVTGGAGFIGSHVCEALLERGVEVVVLDDFNDYYDPRIKRGNIAGFRGRAEVVEGDLRDKDLVGRLFAEHRFTAVFHLAARAGVRPSIDDPELYVSTNVNGTLHLLEACREHGVDKFVFASSSSVYGVNPKIPFAEEDPLIRTISPYAATKLAGEQLCSTYSYLHGIRCVCLRFFTVYGPRQRPDLAISKFMYRILAGQPIDQYGDGSTARDYTYISDIVKGVLAAADYKGADFEIINLGGSDPHTLAELISGVEEVTGMKAEITRLPDQPGDVPRTYADVSKARRLLGYEPSVDLKTGLGAYLRWLRAQTADR
jgi:UDP-glucuronate 4-epimerase